MIPLLISTILIVKFDVELSETIDDILPDITLLRNRSSPNIIFILSDDFGHADIGYNAKDVETPNLMYLADNGLKLTQYYTLCICSASRGAILTGRYDIHNGLGGVLTLHSSNGIALNNTLISNVLYKYGNYSTYCIGKWHVGHSHWRQTPTWRGFQYFYGFFLHGQGYFTHNIQGRYDWSEHIGINCSDINNNTKNCARIVEEAYGIYSTYLMTDKTIEIIKKHHSDKPNKPFFIYLSYQAIHAPKQAPTKYILKYNKTINRGQRYMAAAMIDCMDDGIGNITKTLIHLDLLKNTIIVFTSDNGAPISTSDSVGGENWPLRGGKHSIYEGGTKVPAILYYQQLQIKTNNKYHQYKQLFHCTDWMPTLIEAAGFNIDEIIGVNGKYLSLQFDGKSHWKNLYISNMNEQNTINEWIYYGKDNNPGKNFGLRYKKYKMFFDGDGGKPNLWYKYHQTLWDAKQFDIAGILNMSNTSSYLYDIENDPLETNNIFKENNVSKQLNEILLIMKRKRDRLNQSELKNEKITSAIKIIPLLTINDTALKGGIFPSFGGSQDFEYTFFTLRKIINQILWGENVFSYMDVFKCIMNGYGTSQCKDVRDMMIQNIGHVDQQ